jgi:hypothetical protein
VQRVGTLFTDGKPFFNAFSKFDLETTFFTQSKNYNQNIRMPCRVYPIDKATEMEKNNYKVVQSVSKIHEVHEEIHVKKGKNLERLANKLIEYFL